MTTSTLSDRQGSSVALTPQVWEALADRAKSISATLRLSLFPGWARPFELRDDYYAAVVSSGVSIGQCKMDAHGCVFPTGNCITLDENDWAYLCCWLQNDRA